MEYCNDKARVPHGDGTWSKFMPIREAQRYEHNLRVQRFLTALRAGHRVLALNSECAALDEATEILKKERGGVVTTPTNAD
jgi:hypothetical protein